MKVGGDEWDVAVLDALMRRGVGPRGGEESLATARAVMLDCVGESFERFTRASLPAMTRMMGRPPAQIAGSLLDSWAWYFVVMAAVCSGEDHRRIAGWTSCVDRVRSQVDPDQPGIFLTFQTGLPLLIPHLLSEATDRPTVAFMHDRNPFALQLMTRANRPVRVLNVEDASAFTALDLARQGWNLAANIDVVYEGGRWEEMAFLDGAIRLPAGIASILPRRSRLPTFGLGLLIEGDGVTAHLQRLSSGLEKGASNVPSHARAFFERLVAREPCQWMGWPSLRPSR